MRLSIRTKMIFILILIIIIPIATLGVLSYTKARSVMISDLKADNSDTIARTNDYFLNDFMDNIEKNVLYWSTDPNLQEDIKDKKNIGKLMLQWSKFIKANPNLLWIYLGTSEGEFYLPSSRNKLPKDYDPRKRIWYQLAVRNRGKVIWTEPYVDALTGKITVTAASTATDVSNKKLLGVVGIDFTLERFSKAIDEISIDKDGFTIIISNSGRVLTHPNRSLLGKNIGNNKWVQQILKNKRGSIFYKVYGKDYYISYVTISKTGWKLISLIPASSIQNVVEPIRNRTISVALIGILGACLVGIILSHYISNKIRNIIKYMEQVERGNLNIQSYYKGNDEFGDLNKKFNSMAINISKTMNDIKLLSITDGLTKLYNHKYVFERLEEEIARAVRHGSKLSVAMVDVDHFKDINDLYGHQAGDKSLIVIGNTIKNSLREIDVVGRYGGEEFLIIFPGIGANECHVASERIRKNVENLIWEYEERKLTVSIGIKEFEGEVAEELVNSADSLLYKAKNGGRNRIEK